MKKRTIKILTVSVILLLSSIGAKAQIGTSVVYDPVADANLFMINETLITNASLQAGYAANTTTNTALTATSLASTLAVLERMENFLLKVSEALTTTIMVKNIIEREREIIATQKIIGRNIQKFKNLSPEELQVLTNHMLLAVRTTEGFVTLAYDILAGGFFKMDDGARMSKFFDIDKQIAIQQSIMRAYYVQYSIIDEERAILNAVRR